jgi:hypothetical protein
LEIGERVSMKMPSRVYCGGVLVDVDNTNELVDVRWDRVNERGETVNDDQCSNIKSSVPFWNIESLWRRRIGERVTICWPSTSGTTPTKLFEGTICAQDKERRRVEVNFDDGSVAEVPLTYVVESDGGAERRTTTAPAPVAAKVLWSTDAPGKYAVPREDDEHFHKDVRSSEVVVDDGLAALLVEGGDIHLTERDFINVLRLFDENAWQDGEKASRGAEEEVEARRKSAKLTGSRNSSTNQVLVDKPLCLCVNTTGPHAGHVYKKLDKKWIRERMNVPRHYADTEEEVKGGPDVTDAAGSRCRRA